MYVKAASSEYDQTSLKILKKGLISKKAASAVILAVNHFTGIYLMYTSRITEAL